MWKREINERLNRQKFIRTTSQGEDVIHAPLKIGDERYEIVDILSAAGGFGVVYKAIDKRIKNRKVLIKARKYDKSLFSNEFDISRNKRIKEIREEIEWERRCLKELKRLGEGRLPNLNTVVMDFSPELYGPHIDEETNQEYYIKDKDIYMNEPYLVMQVINGESLGEYVSRGIDVIMKERGYTSKREWEKAVIEYCIEISTMLKFFHKKRDINVRELKKQYYIYQDLKPDNIIITDDTFITLLDLGATKLVFENEEKESISNIRGFGKEGTGTFGYRPPEFLQGGSALSNLDCRVDIYSFGATMFHLLMCKPLNEVMDDENTPIPVENLKLEGYTDETYEFVKKCVSYGREDRFDSMHLARKELFGLIKAVKGNK